MSINQIGTNIALLRKNKGITQEELAKNVGVSAQAVSKWENGGVPDTELLPVVADYFEVSVDSLFGRMVTDYVDLQTAVRRKIAGLDVEDRFQCAFELCLEMEKALFGAGDDTKNVAYFEDKVPEGQQRYSTVLRDQGMTRMGLAGRMRYFLLVPEIQDKDKALLEGQDYVSLFAALGDKAFFDVCVMLSKRQAVSAFTSSLLVKKLAITEEKAAEVIQLLVKYRLVRVTSIELDDMMQEVYTFIPSPAFVAMLIFAREMLEEDWAFYWYMGDRKKGYL